MPDLLVEARDAHGGARPRARTTRRGGDRRTHTNSAYLFLAPVFLVFGLFLLLPLAHAAYLSLFDWDGLNAGTWVGLENYRELLTSPAIRSAFLHSFVLILFYGVLPIAIALFLVSLISRSRHVRGLGPYRTLLFLPQVIPSVVVAIAWRWILAQDGPLNELLDAVGLGGLTRPWLGDFETALPSIGLIGTWAYYGLAMVLFISGVQKIPQSLYDAAHMDGAGPVREFFAVTLPGLRRELVVAATLTVAAAVATFDLVFVATAGGPGNATTVPALEVYRRAFTNGEVGAAAAVATVIAVVVFALMLAIRRVGRTPEEREAGR